MPGTGDLFGGLNGGCAPKAAPTRREGAVFFAISPDPEAIAVSARILSDLRALHRLTEQPQTAETLHVTLLHIGDFPELPETAIAAACAAAAAIDLPVFEVSFDRAATFEARRDRNPLVLIEGEPASGIALLRQALLKEVQRRGIRYNRNAGRNPHMTLVYSAKTVPAQRVAPIRWLAKEFVLIHSHRGFSRHERLGRWKLRS